MFGRATITLDIGPNCSLCYNLIMTAMLTTVRHIFLKVTTSCWLIMSVYVIGKTTDKK